MACPLPHEAQAVLEDSRSLIVSVKVNFKFLFSLSEAEKNTLPL